MNSQIKKLDSSRLVDSQPALNPYVFSFKVPSKKFSLAALSKLNLWQTVGEMVNSGNKWQLSLIAIGSASSIIYPHVPLVGFAAVSANTLTRKKALITVTSILLQVSGLPISFMVSPFANIPVLLSLLVGG